MKIDMSVAMAIVAFALFVPPGSSEANVRLPVRYELPPSSALFSPSRDLTVLHEDLQFDCDSTGCQVSATYHIRSNRQAVLRMSFISPSSRVETVTVNALHTQPGGVLVAKYMDFSGNYAAAKENVKRHSVNKDNDQLVELFGKPTKMANTRAEECSAPPGLSQPKGWEHYVACLSMGNEPVSGEIMFGAKQQWELFQFDFDAAMLPGENAVHVRYHQPYSFAEPYVAYFSSPLPIRYVSYELWPLKEWNVDPGFKIDISVKSHSPRHGFLFMKRDGLLVAAGRFKDIRHGGLLRNSTDLSPAILEELPDDQLEFRTSLQGHIPDRLFIISGEEETLDFIRKDHESIRKYKEINDEVHPLH